MSSESGKGLVIVLCSMIWYSYIYGIEWSLHCDRTIRPDKIKAKKWLTSPTVQDLTRTISLPSQLFAGEPQSFSS